MTSIIIRIGHDDDFSVMNIADFKFFSISSPDGSDESEDLFISKEDFLILDFGGVFGFSTKR